MPSAAPSLASVCTIIDLGGVLADDDRAAAGGHDVDGGLAAHAADAADNH
jgi:hypothetical protein